MFFGFHPVFGGVFTGCLCPPRVPEVWANFEYLYDEIRKIHLQTKDKDGVLSIIKEMVDSGKPDP